MRLDRVQSLTRRVYEIDLNLISSDIISLYQELLTPLLSPIVYDISEVKTFVYKGFCMTEPPRESTPSESIEL